MYEVLIWIRFTLALKEVIHAWLYDPAMLCMKHRVFYFPKVVDYDCNSWPSPIFPPWETLSTPNSGAQVASRVRLYGCRPFSDGRHRRNSTAACERERHGSTWQHAWVAFVGQWWMWWNGMNLSLLKTCAWGRQVYQDSHGHLGETWVDPRWYARLGLLSIIFLASLLWNASKRSHLSKSAYDRVRLCFLRCTKGPN